MLDAPFASLEADYRAALAATTTAPRPTQRRPRRPTVAPRRCFARIRCSFRRYLPGAADSSRRAPTTCRRGHRHPRCRARRLARRSAVSHVAGPSAATASIRSPSAVIHTHGTQGLHRGHLCRSSCCTPIRRSSSAAPPPDTPPAGSTPVPATPATPAAASAHRQRRHRAAPATTPSEPAPAVGLGDSQPSARSSSRRRPSQASSRTVAAASLHWRLKDYRDERGAPVDLVPSDLPDERAASVLAAAWTMRRITARLNTALYRVTRRSGGRRSMRRAAEPLVFEFQDAAGSRARKEFRFDPTTYMLIAFSPTVRQRRHVAEPSHRLGTRARRHRCRGRRRQLLHRQRRAAAAGDLSPRRRSQRLTPDELLEQPVHEGQFRFVGIDDHYFVAVAVTTRTGDRRVPAADAARCHRSETQRQSPGRHSLQARRTR